jgi:hypothetical protein
MYNEDIVSSASAKIAFGAMLDQDLDAVVTREISALAVNPKTPETTGSIMAESFLDDASVDGFVVRRDDGVARVGDSGNSVANSDSVAGGGDVEANGGKAAKTGDEAPLAVLIVLILVSLAAGVCLLARMALERRRTTGANDTADPTDTADVSDANDTADVSGATSASDPADTADASGAAGASDATAENDENDAEGDTQEGAD